MQAKEIAKLAAMIAKQIAITCISFAWIIIHLHTIGYIATLDISPEALRYGIIVMIISALSLPVYIVGKLVVAMLKRRTEDANGERD